MLSLHRILWSKRVRIDTPKSWELWSVEILTRAADHWFPRRVVSINSCLEGSNCIQRSLPSASRRIWTIGIRYVENKSAHNIYGESEPSNEPMGFPCLSLCWIARMGANEVATSFATAAVITSSVCEWWIPWFERVLTRFGFRHGQRWIGFGMKSFCFLFSMWFCEIEFLSTATALMRM